MLLYYALPFVVIACTIAGFLAGMIIERARWNALIDEGYLPTPPQRRRAERFWH